MNEPSLRQVVAAPHTIGSVEGHDGEYYDHRSTSPSYHHRKWGNQAAAAAVVVSYAGARSPEADPLYTMVAPFLHKNVLYQENNLQA